MTEFHELSALEASAKIKSGDLTAEALMRSCFERIDERDELVGAWSYSVSYTHLRAHET